jgi:hypothetical protein
MDTIDALTVRERRVRLYVTVPASTAAALTRRAERNLRPAKMEVAHIVAEALRASGDLPAERPQR